MWRFLLVMPCAVPSSGVPSDDAPVYAKFAFCGASSRVYYTPVGIGGFLSPFTLTQTCPVTNKTESGTAAASAKDGDVYAFASAVGDNASVSAWADWTGRIELHPPVNTPNAGVSFSVSSQYTVVLRAPDVFHSGNSTVAMYIPEFEVVAVKDTPPDAAGNFELTGLQDSGPLAFTKCPCVFTLILRAYVSVAGGASATASDPFLIHLPAGWTYTSTTVSPVPAKGLRFVPLAPCRVMETRSEYNFEGRTGAFGPPTINASETRTLNLPVSNVCSIPSSAKAYVVNTTVIPSGGVDFVTLWPAGDTRPNVWTIRSPDGQIVANSAIVKAGANGGISVYASHKTDLLIDISGNYIDDTGAPGLAFYPLTPCRVVDTRTAYRSPPGQFGPPSMSARQTRKFIFPSTPHCTVPRAAAYSVTITAVPPGPLAYLTAWPDGSAQPNVSSINSFAGRVLANSIIIPAASDGSIDVFAYDSTDFIVDINGYFAADDGQNGLFYYPVTQCRAGDSMVNGGAYLDDTTRTIYVALGPGCSGIPATAKAYALNVTALPNGNPMPFLTAWPTGSPRPNASILNAFQGQIVTNSAIIPAGTNGAVDIYAYRRTNVVVEVSGSFGR